MNIPLRLQQSVQRLSLFQVAINTGSTVSDSLGVEKDEMFIEFRIIVSTFNFYLQKLNQRETTLRGLNKEE